MNKYTKVAFSVLLGETLTSCERSGDDSVSFETADGLKFLMDHDQDCCESVYIESIVGDLADLIGSPILMAEESVCTNNGDDEWTFYKLATIKGFVDIRWCGSTDGP